MSDVKEARTYAGETGGERVARRRDALLDAAFALVARDGWRRVRIDAICQEAGLNKRYFYESFRDVDAVIESLVQRLGDEAIAVGLEAMADAAPEQRIRRAVSALVAHVTEDPRRGRVLFGAVAEEAAAVHRAAAIRHVIEVAAVEGRALLHTGDDPVTEMAAALLVGGTSQAIMDWLDGRLDYTPEAFTDDLVALWETVAAGAVRRAGTR